MNWDAIGAIGEIAGALAVVLSLIYLATQIRVSNRAAQNSVNKELMDQFSDVLSQVSSSEETSDLWLRGLTNDESLSKKELFRFRILLWKIVLGWERAYYLEAENELDPWIIEVVNFNQQQVVRSEGFRSWFQVRKLQVSEKFREVLENDVKQSAELRLRPAGINFEEENTSE